MAIPISSNFHAQTSLPLDSRAVVATVSERDAILASERYAGMEVYVTENDAKYRLEGGTANSNWVDCGATATTERSGLMSAADKARLNDSMCASYIWYANLDAIATLESPGVKIGTIEDFKESGRLFLIAAASSVSGTVIVIDTKSSTVAPSVEVGGYTLFNNGDALLYLSTMSGLGDIWKRIPMHEAKTNLDGLMSASDKVNLSALLAHYMPAYMNTGLNAGNDCGESGHYGNVTYGRPAGAQSGEYFNLLAVRDRVTGLTSQIAFHEDVDGAKPAAAFRGRTSNEWVRLLSERDLVTRLGRDVQENAYPNWLTECGIYAIAAWAADAGQLPPTAELTDPSGRWIVVTMAGAPNRASIHARTQFAYRTDTGAVYMRHHASYSGAGSLAGASEWEELVPPKRETVVSNYAENYGDDNIITIQCPETDVIMLSDAPGLLFRFAQTVPQDGIYNVRLSVHDAHDGRNLFFGDITASTPVFHTLASTTRLATLTFTVTGGVIEVFVTGEYQGTVVG